MDKSIKRANIPVSIRTRMDKIYNYIKYCQRLEDAYRTKHEEVRVLNDYLKRIQRVLPENVSEKCPEVEDIINYIEGLPDVPDTDDLNETLKQMIEQQRVWRDESTRNYNLINRRIEKMSEARDIVSVQKNTLKRKGLGNNMNADGRKKNTKKVRLGNQKVKVGNQKVKVANNKTKRRNRRPKNGVQLVKKSPIKPPGSNKILRRNRIRNAKTRNLGRTK